MYFFIHCIDYTNICRYENLIYFGAMWWTVLGALWWAEQIPYTRSQVYIWKPYIYIFQSCNVLFKAKRHQKKRKNTNSLFQIKVIRDMSQMINMWKESSVGNALGSFSILKDTSEGAGMLWVQSKDSAKKLTWIMCRSQNLNSLVAGPLWFAQIMSFPSCLVLL